MIYLLYTESNVNKKSLLKRASATVIYITEGKNNIIKQSLFEYF